MAKVLLSTTTFTWMCFLGIIYSVCPSNGLNFNHLNTANGTQDTIVCSTAEARLIIKFAEFSPASDRFCHLHNCSSIADGDSAECRLAPVGKRRRGGAIASAAGGRGRRRRQRTVCNRLFSDTDLRKVYEWCGNRIYKGEPCRLREVTGLSQESNDYVMDYHCVEGGTPVMDPCSVGDSRGDPFVLYHNLSSSSGPRQCTCTGNVLFQQNDVHTRIDHLIMADPSLLVSGSSERLQTTLTTEREGERFINASAAPHILILELTHHHSPAFVFTLRIPDTENLTTGFVWFHFDSKVDISLHCGPTSEMATAPLTTSMAVVGGSLSTTPPTNGDGINWVMMTAVSAGVGGLAVIVSLVVLFIVLKRRYGRTSRKTQNAQNTQLHNDHYHSPHHHTHHSHHHHSHHNHHHHQHHNQRSRRQREISQPPLYSEPTFSSPATPAPAPAPGNDVSDYAMLQRHQGRRQGPVQPTATGDETMGDTYDHMRSIGDEYQALQRGVQRQEVIDNQYDSTGLYPAL